MISGSVFPQEWMTYVSLLYSEILRVEHIPILQASPHLDLSEFLVENQGKRCVVVLDVSSS